MLRALASISTLGLAAIAVLGFACGPSVQPPPTVTIAAVDTAAAPAPSTGDVDPTRARLALTPAPIAWETVERDAREKARRRGQPLLVYVRADWDASSMEMERASWKDARVGAAVRSFVALRLDVSDTEGDAQAFADRYGVNAVPEIVVVDAAGHLAGRLSGFSSAAQILELLRRVCE